MELVTLVVAGIIGIITVVVLAGEKRGNQPRTHPKPSPPPKRRQ